MPKADSPNTTILSRRALMSVSVGLVSANVAAAAIAVRAAQAMAPAVVDAGADAELVGMCDRWKRLRRVYLHTDRRASDAEKGVADAMPEKSAVLSEPFEAWGKVQTPIGHGFNHGWTRSELEEYADAKVWKSAYLVPGHSDDDETLLPVPESARAHARRLIAQLDAWEAECERIRASYERLSEVCSNLSDKLTELADRIAVRPSRSWAGLVAKASVIKTAISEETGALEDGHSALMIVPSLLDDLLRLTGGMPARATAASVEV